MLQGLGLVSRPPAGPGERRLDAASTRSGAGCAPAVARAESRSSSHSQEAAQDDMPHTAPELTAATDGAAPTLCLQRRGTNIARRPAASSSRRPRRVASTLCLQRRLTPCVGLSRTFFTVLVFTRPMFPRAPQPTPREELALPVKRLGEGEAERVDSPASAHVTTSAFRSRNAAAPGARAV